MASLANLLRAAFQLLLLFSTIAFHSPRSAFASELEAFDPTPYEAYFKLSNEYWGPRGGRASECLDHAYIHGWNFSNVEFFTVGLEGAGHHLMESLPKSFPGKHGGQQSFSSCGNCPGRAEFAWRLHINGTGKNHDLSKVPYKKFLVLIRDPVDSWTSALRRFWREERFQVDTLERELYELNRSMSIMNAELNKVPCTNTLYLSYELLTHYPQDHVSLMAHFLGVLPTDDGLLTWFKQFKGAKPLEGEEVAAVEKEDAFLSTTINSSHGNTRTLGPYPADCNSREKLLMGRKLVRFSWPVEMQKKNCSLLTATAEDCLREFRLRGQDLLYPKFKIKYPAIMPQYPMSYCSTGSTASATADDQVNTV